MKTKNLLQFKNQFTTTVFELLKRSLLPIAMLLIVIIGFSLQGYGASNTWIGPADGDWNTVSNWSIHVPISTDAVVIPEGSSVIISGTAECNNLTINTGATVTNNGTLSIGNLLSGQGELINSASAVLNIGGDATIATLTASADGNTVDYNGEVTQSVKGTTYVNLITSGSGTKALGGLADVSNVLTVKAGTTLDLGINSLGAAIPPPSVVLECGASTGSVISGTGTLYLGYIDENSKVKVNSVTSGTGGATISCPLVMNASPGSMVFDVANDGTSETDLTVSGVISTNRQVGKTGEGTLMLSGLNTHTNLTNIIAGTIKLGSAGSGGYSPLGTAAEGTWVFGGVLDLNGYTLSTNEALYLTGTGISNGGALINSSTNPVSYSGYINLATASSIGTTGNITKVTLAIRDYTSTPQLLTKVGEGKLTLYVSNSTKGGINITDGTVELGAKDLINNVEPIILNGGTFSTGESTGFDETVSTLALTENSGIHLGTGAHSLHFSASNGVSWTADKILTIKGWTGAAGSSGTAGKIYFGAAEGTLTEAQLSQITFNGYNGAPILLSTGELVPNVVTPVITVGSISDFGNQCINTNSGIQSYLVSGTSLTGAIVVTPPSGFEISDTGGESFESSNTLSFLSSDGTGTISNIPIYVRFAPTAAQTYSGEITHTSTGASTQNVAVSGTGITAPMADFTGSQTSVDAGGNVTFTDNSTNTPTSWSWSFTGGSPSSSTSQNPVITYSTPGLYNVSLTATNGCGSDTETKTNYIFVSSSCMDATIELSSAAGTDVQTICGNSAITAITYNIGGEATDASAKGLPDGVTGEFVDGTFTISGIPTVSGIFNYSVTTTGTDAPCTEATATGTIAVNVNPSAVEPALGDGSSGNPYQIASLQNLYWIAATNAEVASPIQTVRFAAHYIQTADIDASETKHWCSGGWFPIGDFYNNFTGNYNGNGKTISGLYIPNSPDISDFGLFGYATGATFQNIGLSNVNINGVEGWAGGLVGSTEGVTINNCYSTGNIVAHSSGNLEAGGLVGSFWMNSSMSNCYSTCNVSGGFNVGGLVGGNYNSTISNSHYTNGTIVSLGAEDDCCGGLVGYNSGSISKCYSAGTVNGFYYTGGLVGKNDWDSQISNSYSRCIISNDENWAFYGGGLVGANWFRATITNCYSPGRVTSPLMGGLVGLEFGSTLNSFWNTDVAESGTDWSDGGTGINTEKMKIQSTFTDAGWDFTEIWGINSANNDGYPYFVPEYSCSSGTIALASESGTENQTICAGTAITAIVYTIGGGATGATVSPNLPTGLSGVYDTNAKTFTVSGIPEVYGTLIFTVGTTGSSPCSEATATVTINAFGYSGGDGTEGNPFQIATLDDLKFLSENDCHWDKHFIQTDNIDASATSSWNGGSGFGPIGYYGKFFTGTYNGDGKVISGLTINRVESLPEKSQGLFGASNGAYLRRIGLRSVNINASIGGSTGGLVGEAYVSTISESFVTGTVKGSSFVGGLVGQMTDNSFISQCYTTCKVVGTTDNIGGLVGTSYSKSQINDSYATGQVTGDYNVGGLVGQNGNGSSDLSVIKNSYATGLVVGNANTGGLVGYNNGGEVLRSYWDTQTTGQANSSGGTGKTTQEMKTRDIYNDVSWDLVEVWGIVGTCPNWSYPYLAENGQIPEPGLEEQHNPTTGGTIAANTTSVYSGNNTIEFSNIAPASGYVGILEYQWRMSTDNTNFVDIEGAVNKTYTFDGTLTQNTWIRRLAKVVCETEWVESNDLAIAVTSQQCTNPIIGGEISGNQTICSGSDPTAFTSTSEASGNNGTLEYKWQFSDGNNPYDWEDFASSNIATYDDNENLEGTRWYRRLARVTCSADWTGAALSNIITVTVDEVDAGIMIYGPTTFCEGGSVTLAALGGNSWLWSNAETTQEITVNTSGNYYVTITNENGCSASTSASPVTVTVNSMPTISGVYADYESSCYNPDADPIITFSGLIPGENTIFYAVNEEHIGEPLILEADEYGVATQSFDLGVGTFLFSIDEIRVNGGCKINPSENNSVTWSVYAIPEAPTASPQSFCAGDYPVVSALQASGEESAIFNWYYSESDATPIFENEELITGTYYVSQTINGCESARTAVTVTVDDMPDAGTIKGSDEICVGETSLLKVDGDAGGVWASNNVEIVHVNEIGTLSALKPGTAIITYTVNGSGRCAGQSDVAEFEITVKPLPDAGSIQGDAQICIGNSTVLTSDGDASGTWSSSDENVASVNQAGFVEGWTSGTATITYIVYGTGGCVGEEDFTTFEISVSSPPDAGVISGNNIVKVGASILLTSDGNAMGRWNTSHAGVALVRDGLVTGMAEGTVTITYTVYGSGGCGNSTAEFQVTVTPPSPDYCHGSAFAVIEAQATDAENALGEPDGYPADMSSSGSYLVLDLTAGGLVRPSGSTVSVTWRDGSPDSPYPLISVSRSLDGNSWTPFAGYEIKSGTWTTQSIPIDGDSRYLKFVNSDGYAFHLDAVTYSCESCIPPSGVSVYSNPPICEGDDIRLYASTASGSLPLSYSWTGPDGFTSSAQEHFIESTVLFAGTYTVTISNSCGKVTGTTNVTVTARPEAGTITGNSAICLGSTTDLNSDGDAGGTWTSSNESVANVNSETGLVTSVGAGTAIITYTVESTGVCNDVNSAQTTITVKPQPTFGGISIVPSEVCKGEVATLTISGLMDGVNWFNFTVTAPGFEPRNVDEPYTVNDGTIVDNYNLPIVGEFKIKINSITIDGCTTELTENNEASWTVLPDAAVASVTGVNKLCIGGTYTFTADGAVLGGGTGTWSSSDKNVATVNDNGLVTAVAAGTCDITYTITGGCNNDPVSAFKTLNVKPLPTVEAGPDQTVCADENMIKMAGYGVGGGATTGEWTGGDGIWENSDVYLPTPEEKAEGKVVLTYWTNDAYPCDVSDYMTVFFKALPTALELTGSEVCQGEHTLITAIKSETGVIYHLYDINGNEAGSPISGNGGEIMWIDIPPGRYYIMGTNDDTRCVSPEGESVDVVVNPLPTATIEYEGSTCATGTISVTQTGQGGGTYSAEPVDSKPGEEKSALLPVGLDINSSTGEINLGASFPGTYKVTYSYTDDKGCSNTTTFEVKVYALPAALELTGSKVCDGETTSITSTTSQYGVNYQLYNSSNAQVGAVKAGTYGQLTWSGIDAGTGYYTVGTDAITGCVSVASNPVDVVVTPLPVVSITGETTIFSGGTTTLSPASGGTWKSSNEDVATVTNGGIVTGVAKGTASFTFTDATTGCSDITEAVTVECILPSIISVTANPSAICKGSTSTLTVTGSLGGATAWQWYSGSCGGTLVGTGESITESPTETTVYYVRGEGGCATPGDCQMVEVTVEDPPVSGTLAKTPDLDMVCEGTSVSAIFTPGSGGDGTYAIWYRTKDNSGWSPSLGWYESGTSINTTGKTEVEIRTNGWGNYCSPSPEVIANWIVEATPVAGTLEKEPEQSKVCEGTEVYALLNPGAGGNGIDELEYRTKTGTIWSDWINYTDEDPIATNEKTAVEIRTRRMASACNPAGYNTVSWVVEATPIAALLVKTPDVETVCEGTTVWAYKSEGPNGEWSGGNGTDQTQYRTKTGETWSDWIAYSSGTTIPTTGKTGVEVRTRQLADVCSPSTFNSVSWGVEATPVAGTLVKTPDVSKVCDGTVVMATFTSGSGGNGTDELDFRTMTGSSWNEWAEYTSGTAIATTGKTGVEVRTRRMADACVPSEYSTVSWEVEAPIVPPIIYKYPDFETVCEGGVSTRTNAGYSGLIRDIMQYRTQTGSLWSDWVPYTRDAVIYTTGKSGVEIRAKRLGTICASDWVYVSWTIVAQPVAGMIFKSPDTETICEGTEVSATFTEGSGGASCSDTYEYRFDDTGEWSAYIPAAALSTAGHSLVEIRTQRGGCQTGCNTDTRTVSWTVEATPIAGILDQTPDLGTVCEGTEVSALLTQGTGGDGTVMLVFRTNDGTDWSEFESYTSGESIATTGKTAVEIKTRRWANYCDPSDEITVSWVIEATPIAGKLDKTPDVGTVCEGTEVSALLTPGTGGDGTDMLVFRTNDGINWSEFESYTSGESIATTGKTAVEIKSRRWAYYCDPSDEITVSWAVNSLPLISPSATSTSAQYSDPIVPVTITVTDDGALSSLTASTQWKLQSEISWTDGLPNNLSLEDGTANDGIWKLSGIANIAPESYTIKVTINDEQCSGSVEIPLTVHQEDALVDYIGAEIVGEANLSINVTPVQLIATITDIADSYRGDIQNAKVMFYNGSTPISGWLTPTLVNPVEATQGIVSFVWNAPVPSAGYTTYDITVKVGTEGYYEGSIDQVPVTVYRTSLKEFITGGGHIIPIDSKGEYASDPGRKVNFGFNVKWNKTMKNLQGNFNLILRRGKEIYQIKSNALTGLGVDGSNPCSHKAVLTAKANLNRVTGCITETIMGNLSLQVTITDNGDPGVTDRIGVTLYNGSTLLYSSNWPVSSTEELTLDGGNILVYDGLICKASDITYTVITSGKNPSLTGEDVAFTATVYGHDATPQGTLVFTINGETFAGTLDSKGSATVGYNFGEAGTFEVKASYNSTNGYQPSVETFTQLVKGNSFILSSSKNPSVSGDEVTFTAVLTSPDAALAGTVTFKVDGQEKATDVPLADKKATFITNLLSSGLHTIEAVYTSTNVPLVVVEPAKLTQVVNNVSISLASSKNPSVVTETVVFTTTVTGSASIGETVTFFKDGSEIGTSIVDISGNATVSHAFGTAGTYVISAECSGKSVILSQVVTNPVVVLFSSLNPSVENENVTFTATVIGASVGTVRFTNGTGEYSTLLNNGKATWTIPLAEGSYLIKAEYYILGNLISEASLTQVVTAENITVELVSSKPLSVVYGTNITYTATVKGSVVSPTGTITFKDGNTVLKNVLVSGGKASFSTNKLAVGYHPITATYNLTGTVSNMIPQTVTAKIKSAEIATAVVPEIELADLKVYPNPFSDRLRFEFVSPETVNARIELYDMTGRLVKTIFEQPVEGGTHCEAEFRPDAIISAIYFYRVTLGDTIYNGKVIFKKE